MRQRIFRFTDRRAPYFYIDDHTQHTLFYPYPYDKPDSYKNQDSYSSFTKFDFHQIDRNPCADKITHSDGNIHSYVSANRGDNCLTDSSANGGDNSLTNCSANRGGNEYANYPAHADANSGANPGAFAYTGTNPGAFAYGCASRRRLILFFKSAFDLGK